MDCTVYVVAKSQTQLSNFYFHFLYWSSPMFQAVCQALGVKDEQNSGKITEKLKNKCYSQKSCMFSGRLQLHKKEELWCYVEGSIQLVHTREPCLFTYVMLFNLCHSPVRWAALLSLLYRGWNKRFWEVEKPTPPIWLCATLLSLDVDKTGSFVQAKLLDSAEAMAPHSSTLAWKIPWTEEPGGL